LKVFFFLSEIEKKTNKETKTNIEGRKRSLIRTLYTCHAQIRI
jgi:hypothetical protein